MQEAQTIHASIDDESTTEPDLKVNAKEIRKKYSLGELYHGKTWKHVADPTTTDSTSSYVHPRGRYFISSFGRIASVCDNGKTILLRQFWDSLGYQRCVLCAGTNQITVSVHRLVAAAFIGPAPSSKHVVNHIIPKKSLNLCWNLQWVL